MSGIPQLRGEVVARVIVIPRLLPKVLCPFTAVSSFCVLGGPVYRVDPLVS